MDKVTDWDLYRLQHEIWSMDRRWRWIGGVREPGRERALGLEVLSQARMALLARGYRVSKAGNNEHHDLWCEGVKVEVKGSLWDSVQGRYQANLRANVFDVVLFGCCNGAVHWFVLPCKEIGGRRHLAVWSHDPAAYMGRWARFYEAWSVVDELVAHPPANSWQLPLF